MAQHDRIFHPRDIVGGLERDRLVDQHHGDEMLERNIGDLALFTMVLCSCQHARNCFTSSAANALRL
jgi:hypothetical protein